MAKVKSGEQTSNPTKKQLLKLDKNGAVTKSKRPISKKTKLANKEARKALACGEMAKREDDRKRQRDRRTLYIRFKEASTAPDNEAAVKNLHCDIKMVRIPRQANRKSRIRYCFAEFSNPTECEAAKVSLGTNMNLYVDFVGSRSRGSDGVGVASSRPVNPARLHISGLSASFSNEILKNLFPKSKSASVKAGKGYGFVNFTCPADAKAAFDASQDLEISGSDGPQKLTVLYAQSVSTTEAATKKRKAKQELKPSKTKAKKVKEAACNAAEANLKAEHDESSSGEDEADGQNSGDEEVEDDVESNDDDAEEVENDEESSEDEAESDEEKEALAENGEESSEDGVENDEDSGEDEGGNDDGEDGAENDEDSSEDAAENCEGTGEEDE